MILSRCARRRIIIYYSPGDITSGHSANDIKFKKKQSLNKKIILISFARSELTFFNFIRNDPQIADFYYSVNKGRFDSNRAVHYYCITD